MLHTPGDEKSTKRTMTLRAMITAAVLITTVASLARATTGDDDGIQTCSDGTPGLQTRSACCVVECGWCGNFGCETRNGLGGEYCCADQIEWYGEHCLVKGESPCHLVTPSPIVPPYTPSPTSPPTGTPSPTSPPTGTPSPTSPPTGTPSPTSPPTGTPSPTSPPTGTPSPTSPPTGTPSPTSPPTGTPSPTSPPTGTPSPTSPPTGTPSPTSPPTGTPSPTSPPTGTPSPTSPPTGTPSPTSPPTGTPSPTSSPTGTPSPTSPPIVDWCDKLKSAIEANKRVTYKLNINLICDETIIIAKGTHATLTSSAGAPNGKYSISPSSQFIGRRSSASRIASLADIEGDHSLFVVENGGSLSVKNVTFDLSPSDKEGEGKTASSPFTETPVNGSPSNSTTDTDINDFLSTSTSTTTVAINGPPSTSHTATSTNDSSVSSLSEVGHRRVRAIYTAGKVNIENCEFVGSPDVATESVMNGGAIFMVDVDDAPSGPSSVICTGSTFDSYSVGGSGGAIFAEGSGLLQVTGSSFSRNSAGRSRGGENTDKTNDRGADTVGNGKGGNYPKPISNNFTNSTGIRKGGTGTKVTTDRTNDKASAGDGSRGTDTTTNTSITITDEVKGGNGTGTTTERFTNTTGAGGIGLNITTDIFTDTTGIGEGGTGTKTTADIVNVIISAGGGGGDGGSASYSDTTTDRAMYTADTGGSREEASGGAGLRDTDTDITTSRTSNIVGSRAGASAVAGAGGGGSGGAIYAGPNVVLNVRDSAFENNSATDGGAVASYGGTLTSIIISNTVTTEIGFGAVVSNDPDGKTSPRGLGILDSTFKGNTGGATATFNTNVDIKNSIFIDNDGALYFGTLDLEHGFKLRIDGGRFEGNEPTPPSWGAGIFTGSGDLIGSNTGDGQAISCVKLLGVNCSDESECSMVVDEAVFAVTRDDTDCKICNENGQVIEVYDKYGQVVEMPSSSSDGIVGVGFASNDTDSASFIVAMCIVGIVACACCASCIASAAKEFQQEEIVTTTNFTTSSHV